MSHKPKTAEEARHQLVSEWAQSFNPLNPPTEEEWAELVGRAAGECFDAGRAFEREAAQILVDALESMEDDFAYDALVRWKEARK